MKPEDISASAKDFADSAFGKWYIEQLQAKQAFHLDFAQGTDAHNLQVNNVQKAAGIKYALEVITKAVDIQESGYFNKK